MVEREKAQCQISLGVPTDVRVASRHQDATRAYYVYKMSLAMGFGGNAFRGTMSPTTPLGCDLSLVESTAEVEGLGGLGTHRLVGTEFQ